VHQADSWSFQLWTRFYLPDGAESNSKLYFAVKDVSVAGGNYIAAPSPYIHTIDYSLNNKNGSSSFKFIGTSSLKDGGASTINF